MANQYVGEIRMFAGNFAITGWAECNGQLLPIAQNTALFSIIGTFYGGNGVQTFALPDLRGRVPIHQGQGLGLSTYVIGEQGGSENITLLQTEIPAHNHLVNGVGSGGTQASPVNGYPAIESTGTAFNYSTAAPTGQMSPATIVNTGGSQPHSNIQPYLSITFLIALQGIFPSRN